MTTKENQVLRKETKEKEEPEGEPETGQEIEVKKMKRLGTAQEASPVADHHEIKMIKPFPTKLESQPSLFRVGEGFYWY